MTTTRNTTTPEFPAILTADMLRNFVTTENGCTHPRVGQINGRWYIAKCGAWSAYSSDEHVHNELVADAFLRTAGLNVPASREYRVDMGPRTGVRTIRLAEFKADTIPLGEALRKADAITRANIRQQVLAAYPAQAIIAGIDTFTWDNVRVDREGHLWFVDNGASFDFRACGKRKGWFWQRGRVDDPHNGYLSLARHPDQAMLRCLLGGIDQQALWQAATQANLSDLVRTLPPEMQSPELIAYTDAVTDFAAQMVVNPPPVRTELVFVLDRSGSMAGVTDDVIGGFNGLIAKQKKEAGECKVSTILFDDKVTVLHDRVDIRDIGPISDREYTIGGCTALLDALGGAIEHHIDVQRHLPIVAKADKVVFAVITDGQENASRHYSFARVQELVKCQTAAWGWEFLFLGANIDAVTAAGNMGIAPKRAVDFVCDGQGINASYDAVNHAVSHIRKCRCLDEADAQGNTWRTKLDADYKNRKHKS